MMTVAQVRTHIKELMRFRKIARHKMAQMLGMSANTLHIFLLGGNVRLDTVNKVEEFLMEHYEHMSKLNIDKGEQSDQ